MREFKTREKKIVKIFDIKYSINSDSITIRRIMGTYVPKLLELSTEIEILNRNNLDLIITNESYSSGLCVCLEKIDRLCIAIITLLIGKQQFDEVMLKLDCPTTVDYQELVEFLLSELVDIARNDNKSIALSVEKYV